MKKISFFIIAVSILCTAFNKTKIIRPNDYRDSYTGAYLCKKSSTTLSSNGSPHLKKDTLTVYVSKDIVDSVLQISVGSNITKFKLRNGILTEYPNEGHNTGRFFATDSIRLHISYGHGYQSSLVGKKS